MKIDQDIINSVYRAMIAQGWVIFQCPDCDGLLWIECDEGDNDHPILHRMSTIALSQCTRCSIAHKEACI